VNVAEVTREDFEGYREKTFMVSAGSEVSFEAELIEVAPMGDTAGSNGRRAFSLVFRGPHTEEPIQQTYTLDNADLGSLDLFLVPIGPDEKGMKYEAVFT
jgi:hypothetical protein